MSLKAIHILFIVVSTVLAFGYGAWSIVHYFSPVGAVSDLLLGIGSLAGGIGLIVYGKYVLKKLKHISYL